MKNRNVEAAIENAFREQVEKDPRVKNAYLLVHSESADLHLKIAAGATGDMPAHPDQPNYMASVGKLFTATLVGILVEEGKASYHDSITAFLDEELTRNLHLYKGKDYTDEIKIRHLLKQTSGLYDNFWPLMKKLMKEPDLNMGPWEAITWAKDNLTPHFPPGKGFKYTDTNYHLLGLIIESITGKPFHEVLAQYIFKPLGMKHSYMMDYSEPAEARPYPMAEFYHKGIKGNDLKGYAGIDYAGGGVVATTDDLLKFMKALVAYQLVTKETLDIMKNDRAKHSLGIDYGYGVWQFKTIPLLMPKKLNCWGVAGVTGAFLFYHPSKDTFLIGNFNDTSYASKGLRFMLLKVIKKLS